MLLLSIERRSIKLADLAPLLDTLGLFLCFPAGSARLPTRCAASPKVLDVSARLNDWADTAALVSGLDLVITVDTAIAHLAGALGPAGVAAEPVRYVLAVDARSVRFSLVSDDADFSAADLRRLERGCHRGCTRFVPVEVRFAPALIQHARSGVITIGSPKKGKHSV